MIPKVAKEYDLDTDNSILLSSEFEVVCLRVDFGISKFLEKDTNEVGNLYDFLFKYAGLKQLMKLATSEELENAKKYILENEKKILKGEEEKENLIGKIIFDKCSYIQDILTKQERDSSCFHTGVYNNEGLAIHFKQNVFPKHPLRNDEREKRIDELKKISKMLEGEYKNLKYVFSVSWMWNLKVFCDLMPPKFCEGMYEWREKSEFSLGHFGQFFRYDGRLSQKRVDEFRKSWKLPLPTMVCTCQREEFIKYFQ